MIKKAILFAWEILKIAVIAFVIVVPIRYFLFQPFIVRGVSMEPNFHSGDYLIIDQITYRFRNPVRGEVIVFNLPQNPSWRYIKRIIGLPGETVEIQGGKVLITLPGGQKGQYLDESNYLSDALTQGKKRIILEDNEYFVLGDNRAFSSDSRRWGAVHRELIIGRAFFRAWPFTVLARIETPSY
jgi:signal peptidase I